MPDRQNLLSGAEAQPDDRGFGGGGDDHPGAFGGSALVPAEASIDVNYAF